MARLESTALAPKATIVFRVDANAKIGVGHFMRCLALAQAWQASGERAVFATAQPIARLDSEKMRRFEITAAAGTSDDAEQTCAIARSVNAAWIVIDGYQLTAEYQAALKERGFRLMVIDDHAQAGRYLADLVLDQNVTAAASAYDDCAASTRLLLGARYTLLRREFLSWHGWQRSFPARAARVLVTFGGADPMNATAKVVNALSSLRGVELAVVLGPHAAVQVEPAEGVTVLRDVADMPALIAQCDLAIAASGSTCWELAFLQTPMLLLATAENQKPIAAALAEAGAAVNLGWHGDLSPLELAGEAEALIASRARRQKMGAAGRALIDGDGSARLLAYLKQPLLRLRRAVTDDCELIFQWSNDAGVRAASFQTEPIAWEDHCRWFAERLTDTSTIFYVAEVEGAVGQTRFILRSEKRATISVSLDPAVRGRSFGSALILAASERLFEETPVQLIQALIKPENHASLRAFDRAGFRRIGDTTISDLPAAHFILEKKAA